MSINNFHFLNSRYSLVFQLSFEAIILFFAFNIMSLIYVILIAILLNLSLFYFRKSQLKLELLIQLDKKDWTLKYKNQESELVEIKRIINHYFYIIVYTEKNNLVIWRDQVNIKQWKQLLILINVKE